MDKYNSLNSLFNLNNIDYIAQIEKKLSFAICVGKLKLESKDCHNICEYIGKEIYFISELSGGCVGMDFYYPITKEEFEHFINDYNEYDEILNISEFHYHELKLIKQRFKDNNNFDYSII